jgi:hypothetical protein
MSNNMVAGKVTSILSLEAIVLLTTALACLAIGRRILIGK